MRNLALVWVLAGVAVALLAAGDGKDGGFATEMVFVEGGTFMMGCTVEQGGDCVGGEKPARSVVVGDFYIGKTEVTQGLWASVMGRNPFSQYSRYGVGDDYPVYFASWDDTQEFIRKLNEKTGKKYRLPTEVEWEYAARGGKKSRHYKYSGSNNIDEVAWYGESRHNGKTHPVGIKQANELGLHDMSGNLWEWTSDAYNGGSDRVFRGGSWLIDAEGCRVSYRFGNPGLSHYFLGFRLALDP